MRLVEGFSTKSVSLDASLSTGIINKKKKIERMANPLAVRVYQRVLESIESSTWRKSYHDSVVPGEDGKLIKSSNQIPPRSDIASYKDRKSENRKGVHESPPIAVALLCC